MKKNGARLLITRVVELFFVAVVVLIVFAARSRTDTLNPTQIENNKPGTSAWTTTNPARNGEIQGYASATSINRGDNISLFVSTTDPTFNIDVFRMGWYGGAGARLVTSIPGLTGQNQPVPPPDPATGMVECNWTNPHVLSTVDPDDPTEWPSGVYLARLTGVPSGKQQFIIFVVRDDSRQSPLLFQTSVMTYQAYNAFGGKSLYTFNSTGNVAAVKVSFNRPYEVIGSPGGFDDGDGAGMFNKYEYDMVRFLEREGYDVTYCTDMDLHLGSAIAMNHQADLIVGHGEYWSWEMRQNITAARDAGINIADLSANTCYWQIRIESSPITGQANRTIVAYKEQASEDPDAAIPSLNYLITTRWRDQHGSYPPSPEDALFGVMYNEHQPVAADILIGDVSNPLFNGTGLQPGDTLTGLLGPEVDRMYGDAPADTQLLTHSPYVFTDGTTQYSDMTEY